MNLIKDDLKKLYSTFLISALGSTLITTIYSNVDMICVGQYDGPIGTAAISCVNPFWPIMICLGLMAGLGGSVLMNNHRGQGDMKTSNEFFTTAMIITVAAAVLINVLCLIFHEELLILFGAEGEVLEAAKRYSRPMLIVSPSWTVFVSLSTFVRNDGEPILPTAATFAGAVINIVFDILFVFDFGLGLGIYGAGLATASGQMTAFIITLSYFFFKKCKLKFTKVSFPLKKIRKIIMVGTSALLLELSFGITTMVYNNFIMKNLSEDHLAAFSVAALLVIMIYGFFYAFGTALQPISSTNFGAKLIPRVTKTLKIAAICSTVFGVVCFIFIQLFPTAILKIYMDVTPEVLEVGPNIIRLYSLHLPIVGIAIISTYYLQSVLHNGLSFIVSMLRSILLPVLLEFTLPKMFGAGAIWVCLPIAEAVTFAAAVFFLMRTDKKLKAEFT